MNDPELVGRRIAAGLVDVVVVAVLLALTQRAFRDLGWVFGSVLCFAYFLGTETRWGRTLGKAGLGLRVERLDGRAPQAGAIAVRTLLRGIDVLPGLYLIGFMVLVSAGRGLQRLGDFAAGTAVVRG